MEEEEEEVVEVVGAKEDRMPHLHPSIWAGQWYEHQMCVPTLWQTWTHGDSVLDEVSSSEASIFCATR